MFKPHQGCTTRSLPDCCLAVLSASHSPQPSGSQASDWYARDAVGTLPHVHIQTRSRAQTNQMPSAVLPSGLTAAERPALQHRHTKMCARSRQPLRSPPGLCTMLHATTSHTCRALACSLTGKQPTTQFQA